MSNQWCNIKMILSAVLIVSCDLSNAQEGEEHHPKRSHLLPINVNVSQKPSRNTTKHPTTSTTTSTATSTRTQYPEPIGQPYQFRLINDLLSHASYDPRVRPRWNSNQNQQVNIKMNLYQILDVIEISQTLVLHVWITQRWTDEFLGWEPSSYGGLTSFVAPYDQVWRPDTYVFNSLKVKASDSEHLINVKIETNTTGTKPVGEVTLMYPALYQFSCKLQVTMFPFDTQRCNLSMGSWTHDMADIDYHTDGPFVQLEDYITHDEWRLISFKWIREEAKYTCCPTPWVLMHAQLKIQRKPLFYLINLVLPSAVIALVSVVGFFMPENTSGDRSEKINLGITTLLAMAILLLMVVDSMPTTSESVPLLGLFYLILIMIVSIGTLATSYVITVQMKGNQGNAASSSVRKLTRSCGKLLGVRVPPELNKAWKRQSLGKLTNGIRTGNSAAVVELRVSNEDTLHNKADSIMHNNHISFDDRCRLEWQFIASVLDRALLIIFSLSVVLVTVSIIVVGISSHQEGVPEELFVSNGSRYN